VIAADPLAFSLAGVRMRSVDDRASSISTFFASTQSMAEGTIKKLVAEKGFGFIKGQKGELFFHQSSLNGVSFDDLREGQKVNYTEGQGPKGPRADSVSLI
jgi:CspA family cold shock protein